MTVLVLLVVFVRKFAWLLAGLVASAVAGRLIGGWLARRDDKSIAERQRMAELCARADQQHAWVLAGDAAASTANTHQSKSRLRLVVLRTRGCALQRLFWGPGTCCGHCLV